ncbi:MAG TPA: CHAD domain-containing protein [Bacteroidales bacterium]|nr:CHAD domain-containing protein [Bacteroidales bacterium]
MKSINQTNTSLYEFLDQQVNAFRQNFLTTRLTMDQEAIHQMRVAVKKINTIHKLKKHLDFPITIDEKLFELISTIYSNSGMLRDVQLQHTLLYSYRKNLKCGFTELQDFLTLTEIHLEETLKGVISGIDPELVENLTEPKHLPEKPEIYLNIENESLNFIQKKIRKISRLLIYLETESKVHDLRKQTKQLLFVLQFLQNNFPQSNFGSYKVKTFIRIAEKLGKWNDLQMFVNQVNSFLITQPPGFQEDHSEYYLLTKNIENDKQRLIRNLDLMLYLEIIKLRIHLNLDNQIAVLEKND